MVIMIEGPRGSGKSHLIDNFFKNNTNPNVLHYKFAFSELIEQLGIRDQETGPGVHYFSISNIITLLDIHEKFLSDKILILDRSIFSAYVWSIYRKRMDKSRLMMEFKSFTKSSHFKNIKTIYVKLDSEFQYNIDRGYKDIFDGHEDYDAEKMIYEELLSVFADDVNDEAGRNNKGYVHINEFNEDSEVLFNNLLKFIIDK